MKFIETGFEGAFVVESEAIKDQRGFFSRTFCSREFNKMGLAENMVQSNLSVSSRRHTLRGMHFQIGESAEDKLVRCIRGSILDVIIDIRTGSPTFGKYLMFELNDHENKSLYIPRGLAHGFLTLVDDCHIFYQVSNFYSPGNERGIRWNDPCFNIPWPVKEPIISDKDSSYEDFRP